MTVEIVDFSRIGSVGATLATVRLSPGVVIEPGETYRDGSGTVIEVLSVVLGGPVEPGTSTLTVSVQPSNAILEPGTKLYRVS